MEVTLVATKIDRITRKVVNTEVKGIKTVNEDEFYRPLVEVLGNDFLKRYKKGGCYNESPISSK